MFRNGLDDLRLIIILIIVAFWVVRIIYEAFFKSVKIERKKQEERERPGKARPAPADENKAAEELRKFLEALRGNPTPRAEEPPPPPPPPQRRRVVPDATEVAPSHSPAPVGNAPAHPAPSFPERKTLVPVGDSSLAPAPAGRGKRQRGGLSPLERPEPASVPVPAQTQSVHEYLQELSSRPEETRPGAVRAPSRLPGLGVGLREAMLSQFILGPCHALRRQRRPGRQGAR